MRLLFYSIVFLMGVLSMGFQLLASRLLNPHFGSSIIVWAWLISTFLAAFSLGSMLGGWISQRPEIARARWRRWTAIVGVATLAVTVFFGRQALDAIEVRIEDLSAALLVSCL